MKVILCTNRNPDFDTITEYTERAIRSCGHEVLFFDDRQFVIPGRIRERVSMAQRYDLGRINKMLIRMVESERPDICIVAGGHRVSAVTVQRLRDLRVKTVLWTIDPPIDFAPVASAAPFYDHVFCGGTEAIDILQDQGVCSAWLPFGCDEGVHIPVVVSSDDLEKYGSDLAFVGSYYPNRLEIFEKLTAFDLKIWGPGWERVSENSALRSHLRPGRIKPVEWRKVLAAAKIVITLHYQDGMIACHQASPKVYETLACGAFLLVDSQRDVLSLFEDAEHLVCFSGVDDLRYLAEYYLARPEERKIIQRAGRREVLAKHTYRHRMERLFEAILPSM